METYKILGQQAPAAATEVVLYTVPASTQTVSSSITIVNRGAAIGSFRLSVSQGGGATTTKDYIYFDQNLASRTTIIVVLGMTLAATDKVRVFASSANFSFNIFGTEIT